MRSNSFLGSFLSSIVLFRTLLGFLVGICLTLSFSTKAMTEGEFLMEMEAHILRVVRMGRHLLESSDFRAQFPEIAKLDKEQVLGFLARHDAAKIRQDRSTLRAYNLPRVAEGSMAERLGSLHGVNFGELSGAEREQVQALVQRLNDADRAIGRTYLHENGLLDRKGRLTNRARVLLEFEKALDTGDRYFASVDALKSSGKTEFGKAMKPASEFLGDSLGGKVAHYMETSPKFNYGEVTRGLKASTYKLTRIATGKSVDFFLVREGNLSHPPVPLRARLYRVYGPKGKYDLKGGGKKAARALGRGLRKMSSSGVLTFAGAGVAAVLAPAGEKAEAAIDTLFGGSDAYAATHGSALISEPGGIDAFFNLPLHEQQRLRDTYVTVDDMAEKFYPHIEGIQCYSDRTVLELKPEKKKGRRWVEFSKDPNGKVTRIRNHYENSERYLGFTAYVDHHEALSSVRYHRLQGLFHEVPLQDLQYRARRTEWEVKVTPQRMRAGDQIISLFTVQKETISECCQDKSCVQGFKSGSPIKEADGKPRPTFKTTGGAF